MDPCPVMMMTSIEGSLAFSSRSRCSPSPSGRIKSTRARANSRVSMRSMAATVLPAVSTSWPSCSRVRRRFSAMTASSSTTRMRGFTRASGSAFKYEPSIGGFFAVTPLTLGPWALLDRPQGREQYAGHAFRLRAAGPWSACDARVTHQAGSVGRRAPVLVTVRDRPCGDSHDLRLPLPLRDQRALRGGLDKRLPGAARLDGRARRAYLAREARNQRAGGPLPEPGGDRQDARDAGRHVER